MVGIFWCQSIFLNRKGQEIKERDHEKNHLHHHQHQNNTISEIKALKSSSFKRSQNVDQEIKLVNRTSRTVASLYEMEIIEGPFKIYKANLDDQNITVSCNLILKDYDNSHAFDTSIYKTLNKNTLDSAIEPNKASNRLISGYIGILMILAVSWYNHF